MTPKLYPECPSYRGFGWVYGTGEDQLRVLGNDGTRLRVEYPNRSDRPRAWLAINAPMFRALAKWIAAGPAWASPAKAIGPGPLFAQKRNEAA